MSGHSKWSTIKRKKGALDAKRGQVFTKMAKMITVAARQGGGDPQMNIKLRLAVDKARQVNMPAQSIERAIKKGAGELQGEAALEELTYEAYGPGGAALIIEAVSDNKNRTTSEIKHILSDNDGRLGETGSVKWMFNNTGVIRISNINKADQDKIELAAIDAGANDIKEEAGSLVILTDAGKLMEVKKALENQNIHYDSAEPELIPQNPLKIEDQNILNQMEKLMEALDEQEDVNEIYSNLSD